MHCHDDDDDCSDGDDNASSSAEIPPVRTEELPPIPGTAVRPQRMRHPPPMFTYSSIGSPTFVRTISIRQGTVTPYHSMLSPSICVVLPVRGHYCNFCYSFV